MLCIIQLVMPISLRFTPAVLHLLPYFLTGQAVKTGPHITGGSGIDHRVSSGVVAWSWLLSFAKQSR